MFSSILFCSVNFIYSIFLTTYAIGFNCFYIVYSTTFWFFSFISLYSCSTLFTHTNLPWLIYESIETLEIKTSVLFNLAFACNTVLSCFFFFFLIIDLHFLIPAVIAKIFIATAELAIPTGTLTKEANSEIETQPLTAKTNQENVPSNSKTYTLFYAFCSLNHYVLFHLKGNFSFHQISRLTFSFLNFKVLVYHLSFFW